MTVPQIRFINGNQTMSERLAYLEAEAYRTNLHFLAHLIGAAVIEAERSEEEVAQLKSAPAES